MPVRYIGECVVDYRSLGEKEWGRPELINLFARFGAVFSGRNRRRFGPEYAWAGVLDCLSKHAPRTRVVAKSGSQGGDLVPNSSQDRANVPITEPMKPIPADPTLPSLFQTEIRVKAAG